MHSLSNFMTSDITLIALNWPQYKCLQRCFCCLVAQSYLTLFDSMDCNSSVHGICQAEYWSGLPFSPPGDLPDRELEPKCPAWQGEQYKPWVSDKRSHLAGVKGSLMNLGPRLMLTTGSSAFLACWLKERQLRMKKTESGRGMRRG